MIDPLHCPWKQKERWVPRVAGENREAGVKPARARHCKWGALPQNATAVRWEGEATR